MVVSSFFPGRIRLRALLLQDADICAALKTALEQQPAVHKVEYSTHTGSILIEYESDKLPIKKLHALKDELAELKLLCDAYSEKQKPAVLKKIRSFATQLSAACE